ncbi:hypothetical protein [Nocardioides alpinus]|nr:hypothetical protein [Nocardioides alpinus]PKH43654.1 hypothetical protein CXG46_04165 [Nocardioides alpinus]
MRSWLQDFGLLLLAWIAIQVVFDAVFCSPWEWERRTVGRLLRRVRPTPHTAEVVRLRRPIEQVGADVRRLRRAFGQEGMRFAKYEGTRQAYDGVLAEAADTLELTHFLADLPPGVDRDLERVRVEGLLEDAGLLPPLHAA